MEEANMIRAFALNSDFLTQVDPITVTVEDIRAIIMHTPNLKSPGVDLLRNEHLKQLIGKGIKPREGEETTFCELLASLINVLLSGDVPNEVLPLFRDIKLITLLKPNGDIRPIGMGNLYRKIGSKAARDRTNFDGFNATHFRNQKALVKGGIEHIIHEFQLHFEQHPDHDNYFIDATNAFNAARRRRCLLEAIKHYPAIVPFLRSMYLEDSNGFVWGMEDGIKCVLSQEGFHQGDVLGTWAFILTIQPMLNELDDALRVALGPDADSISLVRFFVDDGNISAPFEVMHVIVEFFLARGPEFGFHINKNKGAYLMGKCGSAILAEERLGQLQLLGLRSSIIKVHPEDQILLDPDSDLVELKRHFGAKVLGSFVGTPEYRREGVATYISELQRVAGELLQYPDLQGRWLLFSRCFVHKPVHIFRTVPPSIAKPLVDSFEIIKQNVLSSILDIQPEHFPSLTYATCNFSLANGGLGLHDSIETSHAAYISSITKFLQSHDGGRTGLREELLRAATDHPLHFFGHHPIRPHLADLPPESLSRVEADELQRSMHDYRENMKAWWVQERLLETSTLPPLAREFRKAILFCDIRRHTVDSSSSTSTPHHQNNNVTELQTLLFTLDAKDDSRAKGGTIQSWFCDHLSVRRMSLLEKLLPDNELAWWLSRRSSTSGLWLRDIPKYYNCTLTNDEFRTYLRFSLHLDGHRLCNTVIGSSCSCKFGAVIDSTCVHFVSGCNKDNLRSDIHDSVARECASMLRWMGFPIRVEDRNEFRSADPYDNHRPDITILESLGNTNVKRYLIDFAIASPLIGATKGVLKTGASRDVVLKEHHRILLVRRNGKLSKYKNRSALNGCGFQPFVYASTGTLDPDAVKFLKRLTIMAKDVLHLPPDIIFNYVLRQLSVALVRGVARAINSRIYGLLNSTNPSMHGPRRRVFPDSLGN